MANDNSISKIDLTFFLRLRVKSLEVQVNENQISELGWVKTALQNKFLKSLQLNLENNRISTIEPIETSIIEWSKNNERLDL